MGDRDHRHLRRQRLEVGLQPIMMPQPDRTEATNLINSNADGVYLCNFFTSREAGVKAYEPPFEVLKDLGP
ncbi:MAG: hypothetical protein CMJ64_04055 [Planctomycetaceae bacterium]|nr:hypothetical protein [Planctomycetaceae bacterium]